MRARWNRVLDTTIKRRVVKLRNGTFYYFFSLRFLNLLKEKFIIAMEVKLRWAWNYINYDGFREIEGNFLTLREAFEEKISWSISEIIMYRWESHCDQMIHCKILIEEDREVAFEKVGCEYIFLELSAFILLNQHYFF
jgi:hypothetical protein